MVLSWMASEDPLLIARVRVVNGTKRSDINKLCLAILFPYHSSVGQSVSQELRLVRCSPDLRSFFVLDFFFLLLVSG
jgi:hypothetical protein